MVIRLLSPDCISTPHSPPSFHNRQTLEELITLRLVVPARTCCRLRAHRLYASDLLALCGPKSSPATGETCMNRNLAELHVLRIVST
jgi:hypothetical protein